MLKIEAYLRYTGVGNCTRTHRQKLTVVAHYCGR